MKNLKIILVLVIALTTVIACSKKDDEISLSDKELLVENSPWKFNGLDLTNIAYTGNGEFDVDQFEQEIREENENVFYSFNADGTGEIIDDNDIEAIIWEILDNGQFKISTEDGDSEIIFSDLLVTDTNLEFMIENMQLNLFVKGDAKYLLSISNN